MRNLNRFDDFLNLDGPTAIVLREWLMPVEGEDGVLFPSTFASGNGFSGGYNIDYDEKTGKNVVLIDSVGSQANRIEPIFMDKKYGSLVPQISVTAGEKTVSIFEVGHRAGDALFRCSSLGDHLHKSFKDVLKGDATTIAKIAPTSLVFGVWDSRDTFAKLPRIIASTIRAYDVRVLKRGAVYIPPIDYAEQEVFSEEDKQKAEGDNKSKLAIRGFVHVPASGSHGGVIADGGIRRDATLGIAAIRLLHAGSDPIQTLKLRRYILGLSLVAFTANSSGYLRAGCTLVRNPNKAHECVEVYPNGERKPFSFSHEEAINFAMEAAQEFGVGENRTVPFDKERAKKDVADGGDAKAKLKKAKGKKGTEVGSDE